VSRPRDTFAAFVDVLAEALDDHDVAAEDLDGGDPIRWVTRAH
jgi:hypothetical protein